MLRRSDIISAIPLRTMVRISSVLCSTPTELIMGFVSPVQDYIGDLSSMHFYRMQPAVN